MKLLITLALVAAVAAYPEPIDLPKAEEPAFEARDVPKDIQPIILPKAALPAFEDDAAQPAFEPIDISPLIVPQEVIDMLNLEEIPAEPVKFVDNVEEKILEEMPVLPVNFVDNADNVEAPVEAEAEIAEEIPADAVQFMYLPQAEELALESKDVQPIAMPEAALPAFENMVAQPVFEVIDISPIFVPQEVMEALNLLALGEEIPAEPVKFVDNAEVPVEFAEDILGMPVNFVDNVEAQVDTDNSESLRVRVVDVAENAPAVDRPEAPVDSVRIVEIPERAPRDAGELETIRVNAPVFQDDGLAVKFVDGPVLRGKVFADPRLR